MQANDSLDLLPFPSLAGYYSSEDLTGGTALSSLLSAISTWQPASLARSLPTDAPHRVSLFFLVIIPAFVPRDANQCRLNQRSRPRASTGSSKPTRTSASVPKRPSFSSRKQPYVPQTLSREKKMS